MEGLCARVECKEAREDDLWGEIFGGTDEDPDIKSLNEYLDETVSWDRLALCILAVASQ